MTQTVLHLKYKSKNKHQGREIWGKYVRKQILNIKRKTAKP
jgi:hypothetical protein